MIAPIAPAPNEPLTTSWTLVRESAAGDPERRDAAWRLLVERYREPITKTIRAYVGDRADREDVSTAFLSWFTASGGLGRLDGETRFRRFVQSHARRFARHARVVLQGYPVGEEEGTTDTDERAEAAWAEGVRPLARDPSAETLRAVVRETVDADADLPDEVNLLLAHLGLS